MEDFESPIHYLPTTFVLFLYWRCVASNVSTRFIRTVIMKLLMEKWCT